MTQYSSEWEESKLRARTYPMEYLLRHLGIEFGKYGLVYCPFHKNTETPAASIGYQNILNCFSCDAKKKDNASIYMEVKGCSFRDAVNAINELEGSILPDRKHIEDSRKKKNKKDPKQRFQEFKKGFHLYKELLSKEECLPIVANIQDFFRKKGLDLQQVLKILEENKIELGADKYGNIAFLLEEKEFGLVRREKTENRGTPQPITLKVNNDPVWFICEGITDALTACILGFNSISANSVTNIDKLIEMLSSNQKSKNKHYVICTDQDDKGVKARQKLEDFFTSNNYSYNVSRFLYSSKHNDLNDWYIANKILDGLNKYCGEFNYCKLDINQNK